MNSVLEKITRFKQVCHIEGGEDRVFFWELLNNKKAIPALYKNDANKNHTKNIYTLRNKRTLCRHSLQGSMTVEAALVVPKVFFVWVAFIALTSAVRVHEVVQNELTNTALELSLAAAEHEEIVKTGGTTKAMYSLFALKDLDTGGVSKIHGFNMLGSDVMQNGNWICFKVTYRIELLKGIIPIPDIPMKNQIYVRTWTGYEAADEKTDENNQEIVYVTEHGRVYHKDGMCTHIYLKVYIVGESEAKQYSPCEKCVKDSEGGSTYYITETGGRYHIRRGCSGLKRSVESMTMTEATNKGYSPCTRCGKGGS